jgi:hypothetical protein
MHLPIQSRRAGTVFRDLLRWQRIENAGNRRHPPLTRLFVKGPAGTRPQRCGEPYEKAAGMSSPAGERYGRCEGFPGRVGGVYGWAGGGNRRVGGVHARRVVDRQVRTLLDGTCLRSATVPILMMMGTLI